MSVEITTTRFGGIESANRSDGEVTDWSVDLSKYSVVVTNIDQKESDPSDEEEASTALDVLREDEHYSRIVETADYLSRLGQYTERTHTENVPQGQDALGHYNEVITDSESRVVLTEKRKKSEIQHARDHAKDTIDGPVRTMNMVVNDFKRGCDRVELNGEKIREEFAGELQELRGKMSELGERYAQLMLQSMSIHDRVRAEADVVDTYIAQLIPLREERAAIKKEQEACVDRLTEIDLRIDSIQRGEDAEDGERSELQSEHKRLSTKNTKLNKRDASLTNDIREIGGEIIQCGKRSAVLQSDNEKLQEDAQAIVVEAQAIVERTAELEGEAVASISALEVEAAPNVMDNQLITAAIVSKNVEGALRTLSRSRPDLVGEATAKNKFVLPQFVKAVSADKLAAAIASDHYQLPRVLQRMVVSSESRQYHGDMVRDIMRRNGMPVPDDMDVMQFLQNAYAAEAERRESPTSLNGGEIKPREK